MASRKIIAASAFVAALATGGVVGATLGNPLTSGADPAAAVSTTGPSGPTGASGPGADGHRGPGGPGGFMELSVAAKTLNMTEAELRTALESGRSLADIAKDQGVDKQTLIDALVADANQKIDQLKADLSSRITDMVDGKMPAGGPGKGHSDGPGMGHHHGAHLTAAAKALGMSETDLQTALQGGKSLAEVAKDKGVDKQTVIDAIVAAEKDELAQQVKDGHLSQAEADKITADLSSRITDRVDGKAPAGGTGGGHMGPGHMGPGGMGPDGMGHDGPGFGGPGMDGPGGH